MVGKKTKQRITDLENSINTLAKENATLKETLNKIDEILKETNVSLKESLEAFKKVVDENETLKKELAEIKVVVEDIKLIYQNTNPEDRKQVTPSQVFKEWLLGANK